VKAFYSDTFVLPLPDDHRFPMAKYRRLRERLLDERVLAPEDLVVPAAATWDDLRRTHDADYVTAVRHGTLSREMQRRIGFPWSPDMVERSRRSVGATLAAARQALAGDGVSANLAGGTHHAFRDRGEGYCVFNDIAVAADALLAEEAIARAVVIDCDVHQGNGTAAIFADDPRVFTCSLHGANNFPFKKEVSDLDITFPDGAGDDDYLPVLASTVGDLLDRGAPDLVFYLAGADPYEGDRLGKLRLTIDGLRRRDRLIFDACRERALPVAVAMGGGYAHDVEAIATIHVNTIQEAVRSAGLCHSSTPERKRLHSA
jgi:acetoin utilization deacetylase AcuC-like enzyme